MSPRCPSCFQVLPEDEYRWACRSGQCPVKPDDIASQYAGVPVSAPPITRVTRPADAGRRWEPARPTCASCQGPCQEVCPRCHHALLEGWRQAHSTCIAMNGARATGKSLFIAVLIKQLDQLMGLLNTTVEFANEHTRDTYTRIYEQPLYEARGLMPPTPSANTDNSYQRDPLIFSLGVFRGSRRFLVVRDVAGEDMENPPTTLCPSPSSHMPTPFSSCLILWPCLRFAQKFKICSPVSSNLVGILALCLETFSVLLAQQLPASP
jgi:hypothetical protein